MTTDLNTIKKELKGFSQIQFPQDIIKNTPVKYLCIKDNQEYFYTGGKFVRFGNDCLILNNGSNNWSVKKYDLQNNKGYGTKKHMDAIKEFGIITGHRKTFKPCSNYV